MKLAIVIPYYKQDFFEETLTSVAEQIHPNFRLYIGNDASPNDPAKIIQEIVGHLEPAYYAFKENLGGKDLVAQWERILENVEEEWFMILGDDDVLMSNFTDEFFANLPATEMSGCNVVKIHQKRINESGKIVREGKIFPETFSRLENWNAKFLDREPASLSEHIFRRSAFEKQGFRNFPLAWGTDDAAVFETAGNKPIYFLSKTSVLVRVSSVSISGSADMEQDKRIAHYYFWEHMINTHYKEFPYEQVQKMIDYQISFSYKNLVPFKLKLADIYLYFRKFRKIIQLPKVKYYLQKQHGKQV